MDNHTYHGIATALAPPNGEARKKIVHESLFHPMVSDYSSAEYGGTALQGDSVCDPGWGWRLAMNVRLRPIQENDEPFLYQVYADSRSEEIALTGWSPHQAETFLRLQFGLQQQSYPMQFPNAEYFVILFNETPVGRLIIQWEKTRLLLIDISLLSAFRNQGVGSRVIQQLQNEALAAGRPIHLSVIAHNHGARRLYQRLGFTETEVIGAHLAMVWNNRAQPSVEASS